MTVVTKKQNPSLFELVSFVARGRAEDPFMPAYIGRIAEQRALQALRAARRLIRAERDEDGRFLLIATDGKRLHLAKVDDQYDLQLAEGNWEPVITKGQIILKEPVQDGAFPNWRRVVPEEVQGQEVIEITDSRMSRKPEVDEKLSRMLWSIFDKAGQIVNIRYLLDLITGEWEFSSKQDDHPTPLIFSRALPAGEATALIMPIAVDP